VSPLAKPDNNIYNFSFFKDAFIDMIFYFSGLKDDWIVDGKFNCELIKREGLRFEAQRGSEGIFGMP
jgi:hypothetical protein